MSRLSKAVREILGKQKHPVQLLSLDADEAPILDSTINDPTIADEPPQLSEYLTAEQIIQNGNVHALGYFWESLLKDTPQEVAKLFLSDRLDNEGKKALFKSHVKVVNIETSTYCNRKCTYCPVSQPPYRASQTLINDNMFGRLIDQLREVDFDGMMSMSLYNEPLAAKDKFVEKIRFVKSLLPSCFVKFSSNGDYLDSNLLDELAEAGADAIYVTLHHAPKDGYDEDDRLDHFKKFFKRLGLESPTTVSPGKGIRADLFYRNMHILVMANNWIEQGHDRAGSISYLSNFERLYPCSRPFREMSIANDGNVYPCCEFYPDDQKNNIFRAGNINETSVFEIYASKLLASFRKDLFGYGTKMSPCDTCRDGDNSDPTTSQARVEILRLAERATQKSEEIN